jgi:hypothetical protein
LDDCEISFAVLLQRDAVAVFSAGAGFPFFNGSPFPDEPVNWRRKSSSALELEVFSWMLMPAFSLRMRLSRVSRTLPLPCVSPGLLPAPLLMKRRLGYGNSSPSAAWSGRKTADDFFADARYFCRASRGNEALRQC